KIDGSACSFGNACELVRRLKHPERCAAAGLGSEPHILEHRKILHDGGMLEAAPETGPGQCIGRPACHILALEPDLAGTGLQLSRKQFEDCFLSATVRTDPRMDPPLCDIEQNTGNRRHAAKALA